MRAVIEGDTIFADSATTRPLFHRPFISAGSAAMSRASCLLRDSELHVMKGGWTRAACGAVREDGVPLDHRAHVPGVVKDGLDGFMTRARRTSPTTSPLDLRSVIQEGRRARGYWRS